MTSPIKVLVGQTKPIKVAVSQGLLRIALDAGGSLRVAVSPAGLPGPPGESASVLPAVTVRCAAVGAVSGHRVVKMVGLGLVAHADAADVDMIYGLSSNAAADGGDVDVITAGPVQHSGWAWTPGAPLFCGASGQLTATPPVAAKVRRVALALTATVAAVDIQPSITLVA